MKRLIYKVREIPLASETFIISNIAHAIKKGFNVQVIADVVYPIETSSQQSLIHEMGIEKLILQNKSTTNKIKRIQDAILFLLNPFMFYFFCQLSVSSGRWTLDHVYTLKFYKRYKKEDVFHVHFAVALFPLLVLKKIGFLKSKVVVTFHGYDAYALPKDVELTQLIDDYRNNVFAITVNSQFLRTHLILRGFDEHMIHVIPVGIDCTNFEHKSSSRIDDASFNLVSVGRLIPLKGHRFGIEVVKQLLAKGHNVHYTIVGYGELMKPLKELISTYKLKHNITLAGKRSQDQIATLLKDTDVFLMTSTYDSTNRREAFGLVSLEAQAAGVPVVGFDSGGFPETLVNGVTGYVVPDRDVDAMTTAVKKLILNTELLADMKEKAREHVLNTFEINKVAEGYFNLYH